MPRVHTHYANLKVARDAPIEVIKAAYKSLSLKYHPDKHQGSEKAARIMRIINTSYEVLSDPVSRLQHDQWIASQETDSPPTAPPSKEHSNTGTEPPRPNPPAPEFIQVKSGWSLKNGWQAWFGWGIVFITVVIGAIPRDKPARVITPDDLVAPSAAPLEFPRPQEPPQVTATPLVPMIGRFVYSRPQLAPNGHPWPITSDYLDGYDVIEGDGGHATLTIDNTQNSSDVFVKLYDRDLPRPFAVRWLFVLAHAEFKITNLIASTYDVRYRDLDTGAKSRSEPFPLRSDSTGYSIDKLTLYTTTNGKMKFDPISEEEFDQ